MLGILMSILIYLIPLAAIVFFIVSLCYFIAVKKQYKLEPGEINMQKKNTAKTLLIVASVIMGVFLVVIIAFVSLMFMAVAYM